MYTVFGVFASGIYKISGDQWCYTLELWMHVQDYS